MCINFHLFHFTLSDTEVLNSLEELCIMQVAAVSSFAKVLNPRQRRIYIVIHRQTVSLYHNSSMGIETLDAWSWDRNPLKFTLENCYILLAIDMQKWGYLQPKLRLSEYILLVSKNKYQGI